MRIRERRRWTQDSAVAEGSSVDPGSSLDGDAPAESIPVLAAVPAIHRSEEYLQDTVVEPQTQPDEDFGPTFVEKIVQRIEADLAAASSTLETSTGSDGPSPDQDVVIENESSSNSRPPSARQPEVSHDDASGPKTDFRAVSDLALELVLNEIALQARLTTNATGAVIALERAGELACKGTTGATASDVAICLRAKSGIASSCFETGEARRIDDLEGHANADSVAYRRIGVRSILVVPVQSENGPVIGVVQIFSPRPNAFCERDLTTLQALARRVATNVDLVQGSNVQTRASLEGESASSSASQTQPIDSLEKSRRMHPKSQVPKFVEEIFAQRYRLASADWISVLAKSAIVLVLVGGCIVARSCWERSGHASLVQLIRQTMPHPSHAAAAQPRNSATSSAIKIIASPDPSSWPLRTVEHSPIRPSITIERKPLHAAPAASASAKPALPTAASGDHDSLSHQKTPSKADSAPAGPVALKDPAAAVLPKKIGDGASGPEVLPTQAAMARLVQRVEPEYPNAARQQRIQGTVLLDVIVDANGAVEALSPVSGESQLMAAAQQAVRQWKFQPLMKDGAATKFESRIAIDFTLVFEGSSPKH